MTLKTEMGSNPAIEDGWATTTMHCGKPKRLRLVEVPLPFLQWRLASRGILFHQHMAHGDRVARFEAHLPVAVTLLLQRELSGPHRQ